VEENKELQEVVEETQDVNDEVQTAESTTVSENEAENINEDAVADKPLEQQTKKELIETVKAKEAYAEECKTVAQRLQADFENYKKRTAKNGEYMKQLGQEIIMSDLIAVLDNCNLARKYITNKDALVGFTMMEDQLNKAMSQYGLKEIEVQIGDAFDPKIMNAQERVKKEGQEGKVIEIVSKGYCINDKQVRAVTVIIGE
jgi:grpE